MVRRYFSRQAQKMVLQINEPPMEAHIDKPLGECKVAFLTTAGVHLKSQEPFETEKGDPTYRIIPGDINYNDLMITHTHYNHQEADKDINVVFPLEILQEFAVEGIIGAVAPRNFGMMGYIPMVNMLRNKVAPQIADILVEDQVDILLMSPG